MSLIAHCGDHKSFEVLFDKIDAELWHIMLTPAALYDMCRTFPRRILDNVWSAEPRQNFYTAEHPVTGGTAWHAAAENPHLEMMLVLGDAARGLINNVDANNQTALFSAVAADNIDKVESLSDYGINASHALADGTTAVHRAAYLRNENSCKILKFLLPLVPFDISAGTQAGTILHTLIWGLRDSVYHPGVPEMPYNKLLFITEEVEDELIEKTKEFCKAILYQGADRRALNAGGMRPFDLAVLFGFEEIGAMIMPD